MNLFVVLGKSFSFLLSGGRGQRPGADNALNAPINSQSKKKNEPAWITDHSFGPDAKKNNTSLCELMKERAFFSGV